MCASVDLERADRAHVQVGEVARHFPVNPVFHFAVVLSGRVRLDHHLVRSTIGLSAE